MIEEQTQVQTPTQGIDYLAIYYEKNGLVGKPNEAKASALEESLGNAGFSLGGIESSQPHALMTYEVMFRSGVFNDFDFDVSTGTVSRKGSPKGTYRWPTQPVARKVRRKNSA